MKTYALYWGDKFLIVGSRKELAEYLGVKEKTISFYASETWKKRRNYNYDKCYIVIEVENDK